MLKFLPPVIFAVLLYGVFTLVKGALGSDSSAGPSLAPASVEKSVPASSVSKREDRPSVRTEVFCRGYASGNGRTIAWLTNGTVLVGTATKPLIIDLNGVRKDGVLYPFRRPEHSATILRPSANVLDVWKGVTASPGGTEGRPPNLVHTASKEAK